MKKVAILLVLLTISAVSFTQTITIDVKEAESYIRLGLIDFQSVLIEPDIEEIPRTTNCRYVINLNDSTSTFYKNGNFVSEVKITYTEVLPGVYSIISYDTDIETYTIDVPTTMSLDTNLKTQSFTYQYYDQGADRTIVDVITKFNILLPA
jgi:hypothetical protein